MTAAEPRPSNFLYSPMFLSFIFLSQTRVLHIRAMYSGIECGRHARLSSAAWHENVPGNPHAEA